MIENRFSVDSIDKTNITFDLQAVDTTIKESGNLLFSEGINLKSRQNTEKRWNFILKQFS